MLKDTGNSVPHKQQLKQANSDSESYTGSSGSYSETASQHSQPQMPQRQQLPHITTPQSASKSPRSNAHSSTNRRAPPTPPPPQNFEEGEDSDGEDIKNRGHSGKDRARRMVNAVLNAPTARMREVSARLAGRDSQRITIYVFFVVSLAHLLFVILSCTLSQIDEQGGGCYTYWGYKANCDAVSYTNRTSLIKNCNQLRSTLETGAAFSIMSILTSTAIVVVSWLMCCRLRHTDYVARHQNRYRNVDASSHNPHLGVEDDNNNKGGQTFNPGQLKLVTIIIVAVSIVFELIAWAVIAGVETLHYCDEIYHLSKVGTYGVGFGLGLTAWIMEILVYVAYIVIV